MSRPSQKRRRTPTVVVSVVAPSGAGIQRELISQPRCQPLFPRVGVPPSHEIVAKTRRYSWQVVSNAHETAAGKIVRGQHSAGQRDTESLCSGLQCEMSVAEFCGGAPAIPSHPGCFTPTAPAAAAAVRLRHGIHESREAGRLPCLTSAGELHCVGVSSEKRRTAHREHLVIANPKTLEAPIAAAPETQCHIGIDTHFQQSVNRNDRDRDGRLELRKCARTPHEPPCRER